MADESLLQWLADLCSAGAALGCLYTLMAALLVVLFSRRAQRGWPVHAPVTLLKPLCGGEPGLMKRLAAFCTQDYGAPIQIVCGVQHPSDHAIAVVEDLKRAFPDSAIEMKIDGRAHGRNRKVSNLVNMTSLAHHDLLVLSDSDIEVEPQYLECVVGTLLRPGVGAVTCLYHGQPRAPGLWARIAALSINVQFLPNAIVAMALGLAHPCFGSTIALRRETLDRIGGFGALANHLADDYALGEAVRATGQKIAVAPGAVGHACFHRSVREVLTHKVRWAKTIRTINPVGHIGSIITNPLPLALLALLGGAANGVAAVFAAVACRAVLCLAVEKAYGLARQPCWLVPLCDLIEFAAYVAAFLPGRVSWKGCRYRLGPDGRLVQDVYLRR